MSKLTKEEYDLRLNDFESMDFKALGESMVSLKTTIRDLEYEVSRVKEVYAILSLTVVPAKLDEAGVQHITLKDIGRLGQKLDYHVNVKVGKREEWFKYLEDNGAGDLIKPGIHAGTQKAYVKEQLKKATEEGRGNPFPEDVVQAEPFYTANVTKV